MLEELMPNLQSSSMKLTNAVVLLKGIFFEFYAQTFNIIQ